MKTALVTGGNRGLGEETCRQLAHRGFRVLLSSRDERQGAAARGRLSGLDVEACVLDVTDGAGIGRLADRIKAEGIRLDLLINNAGIALDGFNADVVRRTLEVNFFGALDVTEGMRPLMGRGSQVVMVSSGLGELAGLDATLRDRFTDPALTVPALVELVRAFSRDVEAGRHRASGWPSSAYRVSKIGLNALARVLARAWASEGIRVNAVCPGWVRTDMGGSGAPRSVPEGAASIVAMADLEGAPTGGFFRDGHAIDW